MSRQGRHVKARFAHDSRTAVSPTHRHRRVVAGIALLVIALLGLVTSRPAVALGWGIGGLVFVVWGRWRRRRGPRTYT